MGTIARTTKREVLGRAKSLAADVDQTFTNRTYIICNDLDEDRSNVRDREFLTVQLVDGVFDNASNLGGALHYQCHLRVTVWQQNNLDRQNTATSLLTSADGILALEQKLVSKFNNSYLDEGLDGNSDSAILFDTLKPISDSPPARESDETYGDTRGQTNCRGVISVDFLCSFAWDTST